MKTVANEKRVAWLIPAGLILLSVVPVAAGALRIAELTGGAEVTPENARFFASPVPVVLHILSASLYSSLGLFSSPPVSAGGGRAGTAPPDGSWPRAGWRLRFRVCG